MIRTMRHNRVRAKISGTALRPRISVFRSLKGMWVQLVDDVSGKTLLAVNHRAIKKVSGNLDQARALGELVAAEAKKKNISQVVFDRGGYKYHGRVKSLAEGARAGGLNF